MKAGAEGSDKEIEEKIERLAGADEAKECGSGEDGEAKQAGVHAGLLRGPEDEGMEEKEGEGGIADGGLADMAAQQAEEAEEGDGSEDRGDHADGFDRPAGDPFTPDSDEHEIRGHVTAGEAVWRVSVRPSAGADVLAATGLDGFLDWGGGLVWLTGPADAVMQAKVENAVRQSGGTWTLMRAPDSFRNAVRVIPEEAAPLATITRRLKAALDPAGILNPGRLYAGL